MKPADVNTLVKNCNTLSGAWVSERVRIDEESNLKIEAKRMFENAKKTQIALGKVPNLDMEINQQQ